MLHVKGCFVDPFKAIVYNASGTKKSIQIIRVFLEAFTPENDLSLRITHEAIKGIQLYEGIKEIATLSRAFAFQEYRIQPLNKFCDLLFKVSYIGTSYLIIAQPDSHLPFVFIELATISGWGLNAWLVQRKMQKIDYARPKEKLSERCNLIQSTLEVVSKTANLAKMNGGFSVPSLVLRDIKGPSLSLFHVFALLAKIVGIAYIILSYNNGTAV